MLCDYQKHGYIANGYQTWVCAHLSVGVETFIELEVLGTFGGQGPRELHAPYSYWVQNFTKSPPFNAIAHDNKHSPFERNMHNPLSELLKHSPFERSLHNSLPIAIGVALKGDDFSSPCLYLVFICKGIVNNLILFLFLCFYLLILILFFFFFFCMFLYGVRSQRSLACCGGHYCK